MFQTITVSMSAQNLLAMSSDMQPMEDCRDYLRTGRCKYGASCKYNHPANVQNGGGMKVPLNPSEPLFPLRPGETVCQYYLKHGTCKFGQACKFDHPIQTAEQLLQTQGIASAMRQNDAISPQIVLNPIFPDQNGQSMMLQLLPQRPDEPNCIYFLKNGRCKYGATCRYHHPVSYSQQQIRIDKTPARRQIIPMDQMKGQKVHYVTQVLHNYPQGQIIVTDNSTPVTFINVDGFNQQGYQIISGVEGVPQQYCFPTTTTATAAMTEQSSSGSSIASFETANDHFEVGAAHWNRSKRNGSTNNLNGSTMDNRQPRAYIPHVSSEGNMIQQQRRTRAASYGSAVDHGSYYDTGTGNLPRTVSSSSWRGSSDRLSSFENSSRMSQPQLTLMPDGTVVELRPRQRSSTGIANTQRRPDPMHRRNARTGEHDEGFTMMTSALLNMLDTPEEVSGENYSEDEYIHSNDEYYESEIGQISSITRSLRSDERLAPAFDLSASPPLNTATTIFTEPKQQVDSVMFQRLSLSQNSIQDDRGLPSWTPSWQSSLNGRVSDGSLQSMRGAFPGSHIHPSTPGSTHDSDVLYYSSVNQIRSMKNATSYRYPHTYFCFCTNPPSPIDFSWHVLLCLFLNTEILKLRRSKSTTFRIRP
jgi:Zinc finger C-x8-C-x5-C-x3-H type (and similar)